MLERRTGGEVAVGGDQREGDAEMRSGMKRN